MSLVPIILLVCSLVPYTGLTQEAAMDIVSENLGQIAPENVTDLLESIVDIVTFYVPELSPVLHWLLSQRFVFSICILVIAFTAIYTWVPQKKLRLLAQLPGALFTSLGWMAISWLFSTYISAFDGFSAYGSLATIVIAMLWMYYCMFILLLGAYLNVRHTPE